MAYRLLSLTAISGEFPTDQLNRLPGSPYYLESVVTALKKDGLLRTYYRDKLRGYRLGPRAKATLLESRPDRFASYLTGDTDTNRLKCEIDRRLRLHRLAETYMTMDNAGVCVYRDEKPAIFAPEGYAGGRIVYPAFFSSREVKEMGIDTTKIRSSRSTGILLAPSGIFVTYNSSSALMKWRYKSEMRVKALIWSVICQQRLSPQFRHEDVHGLILGNSMDLAYQILTSTGGRKHDFFMLDGSYEHFLYLTNDHQGEVILALLCDPGKTAELDRIASRKEAMLRKRQIFYLDTDAAGMYRVYEGRIVQARVIAVAEKVVRVEVFGVETSILARDLAWDWIGDAHERFSVGDEVLVRILSVRRNSLEDLGIKADIKSISENTDRDNLQKCRIQGKYAGRVTDVHKGVVYVRLSNGVNAVAHSCYDYRMPGKKDDVSFAVTRLDMERGVAVGIITRIIRQNL